MFPKKFYPFAKADSYIKQFAVQTSHIK